MERQTLDSYFHRLVHGPPFKPGEEMKYEIIRNASFQGWPSSVRVRPPQLAKEGFYYIGHSDEVHCFRCGIIIKDWESGFVPSDKHRQYSPLCPVVLGMDKENVARYSRGEDDEGEEDEEEDEEQQQQPEGGASGGASDDTHQLRQDLERMQKERTCKVCMELEACVVFLPCGHLVCCTDCATRLNNCPICRSLVRGTIRAYLS